MVIFSESQSATSEDPTNGTSAVYVMSLSFTTCLIISSCSHAHSPSIIVSGVTDSSVNMLLSVSWRTPASSSQHTHMWYEAPACCLSYHIWGPAVQNLLVLTESKWFLLELLEVSWWQQDSTDPYWFHLLVSRATGPSWIPSGCSICFLLPTGLK